jgi:hypothetical protein
MNTLSIDDGVWARKIYIFKDTGSSILSIGKAIGFKTVTAHDNHLSRKYITYEFSAIDIKSTCFRREDPPSFCCLPYAQRAESLRVTNADQLIFCHNRKAEGAAYNPDCLEDTLLDGCFMRTRNEMDKDLRVNRRLKDRTVSLEVAAN